MCGLTVRRLPVLKEHFAQLSQARAHFSVLLYLAFRYSDVERKIESLYPIERETLYTAASSRNGLAIYRDTVRMAGSERAR